MRTLFFLAAVLIGLATSGCTIAHAHPPTRPAAYVVVHHPPPARTHQHHGHHPHHVWVSGHWVGHGHHRHYVQGRWVVRPPRHR